MEKELIFKSRSFSSCILAAYKLMSDNLKGIIRSTWLPVLLMALFGGIFMALNVHNERVIQWGITNTGLYLAASLSTMLITLVCSLWAVSRLMSKLNDEDRRWNFLRALKLWIYVLAIALVIGAVFSLLLVGAIHMLKCDPVTFVTDNWLALMAVVLITALFLLPFNYICMRYLYDRKACFWKDLPKTYMTGLRHLSLIFLTTLISGIITGIIALVIYLPLMVLITANAMSTIGVVSGDPSGMPSSFPLLLGATTFVVTVLIWYVSAFQIIIYLFMYGSIEKLREERRNTALVPAEELTPTPYNP